MTLSRDVPLIPENSALLFVDVQNFSANRQGAEFKDLPDAEFKEKYGWYFDMLNVTVIPNMQRIQRAARNAGVEVMYTTIESLTRDGRDRANNAKLLEALRDVQAPPDQITAIHIRTHPRWMSVCNITAPQTGLAAKFSYRQTAAMSLLGHDTGAIGNFTDALANDGHVVALRDRVHVTEDARLSETQSEVSITLSDGSVSVSSHVPPPSTVKE